MNLFVLGLILVNGMVQIQARSISVVGNVRVEQDGDKWTCDMLQCPRNTNRCFVSVSNRENPSVLKHVNICYSENNKILAQKETTSSTNPNNQIDQTIDQYRNGGMSVSGNSHISNNGSGQYNFNEKEFNENMEREMNNLQSDLEQMQKDIQRGIDEQQRALEKSLKEMEHNLAHMFD